VASAQARSAISLRIINALRCGLESPQEFCDGRDQQLAYQPSGKGMYPQTSPLSLAAFGR
jgi:hypothetical protein